MQGMMQHGVSFLRIFMNVDLDSHLSWFLLVTTSPGLAAESIHYMFLISCTISKLYQWKLLKPSHTTKNLEARINNGRYDETKTRQRAMSYVLLFLMETTCVPKPAWYLKPKYECRVSNGCAFRLFAKSFAHSEALKAF